MKNLRVLVLAMMMAIVPAQRSHALIGAGGAVAGSSATMQILLGGVGVMFMGPVVTRNIDFLAMIIGVGLIFLDEDTNSVQLNEINEELAQKIQISKDEMDIFNAEIDQLNIIVSEVASELNANSTVEDSKAVWANYTDMLSPETVKTMKAIISQAK